MSDLYIKVKSAGYQRNPDWMPMPTVTVDDNVLYGLFIVFEDEYNQLTFRAQDNGDLTIDWGDGSTPIATDGTVQVKVYDFNQTLPNNTIYQWEDGRNYKQVLVTITPNDTDTNRITFTNNSGINNNGETNFVDIACAFKDNNMRLSLSSSNPGRRMSMLKIFKCFNTGTSGFFFEQFQQLDVEVFEVPDGDISQTALQVFLNSTIKGDFRDLTADETSSLQGFETNKPVRDITNVGSTGLRLCKIPSCRDILNISGVDSMWQSDIDILGDVTITTTNFRRMFQSCTTRRLNVVSMPSTPGGVSSNGGAFSEMRNLQEMVLPGFRVGFDISNSKMSATALNALFTSLGTANGTQTIIVSGNPGASTCDTTIATNKGYTVII